MLAELHKQSLYAVWPVLTVLDCYDKNELEIKAPVFCDSRNLDDEIWDRRLVIILINKLALRSDLKAVRSREQGGKDSVPRPIPHALDRRRSMSGVVLQYLASKGGERHLVRRP